MTIVNSAIEIYRRDGIVTLAHSSLAFLRGYFHHIISGGKPALSIRNSNVTVKTTSAAEMNHVKGFIEQEFQELSVVLEELERDDIFYDIGANTGIYSLFAHSECERAIAFEPHPSQITRLKENAALNGIEIDIREVAVSDKTGTAKLDATGNEPAGHGTASIGTVDKSGLTVRLTTIDSLIDEGLPSPDVVKIDVEGHELAVLQGMEKTLTNSECRAVFIEVHDGVDKNRLLELLETKGYSVQNNNVIGDNDVCARLEN